MPPRLPDPHHGRRPAVHRRHHHSCGATSCARPAAVATVRAGLRFHCRLSAACRRIVSPLDSCCLSAASRPDVRRPSHLGARQSREISKSAACLAPGSERGRVPPLVRSGANQKRIKAARRRSSARGQPGFPPLIHSAIAALSPVEQFAPEQVARSRHLQAARLGSYGPSRSWYDDCHLVFEALVRIVPGWVSSVFSPRPRFEYRLLGGEQRSCAYVVDSRNETSFL